MLRPPQIEANAPWKQRFQSSFIFTIKLAKANPQRGLVLSNHTTGTFQISAWDLRSDSLTLLTNHPNGLQEGWISADGDWIFYLQDDQGNEHGHLMRVPFGGGPPEDLTPDLAPYTLRGVDCSLNNQILAFNPINEDGFQLYVVDLAGGAAPRRIYGAAHETWHSLISADGDLLVTASSARAGGSRRYSLLAFDLPGGAQIAELWDGAQSDIQPVMFARVAGDPRLLATSNASGFTRPLLWDPRSGERSDLPVAGLEGEIQPLDWSSDGRQILLCQLHQAAQQLYIYDLATATLNPVPHPSGTYYFPEIGGSVFGPDGDLLVLWDESTHPTFAMRMDPATGAHGPPLLSGSDLPAGQPWRSVTFASSDGQEIQAWLGLPAEPGPHPVIIDLHGGPHYAIPNVFNPLSQAWIDHGYAYLTVNYRGSTTFGSRFREQIWGDIGHWELEDVVAARRWLIEQGLAQPDAILISGGSYGGYLTLLALGRFPDLWAGGLAVAAIGDWSANFEDASEALKGAMTAWFQGTPAEKAAAYARSSPISYADHVQAPLLIIQGRNDTRTPARQMELYIDRLQSLGKAVEVVWYDAGHGGGDLDEILGFQERMLAFAYAALQ